MYSSLQNIQILVSLLKQYNVRNIVISAGTRHTPFVYSVEQDSFFKTYSIVDERSASFFAIGLIEKLREPVAIVCTSGTASANYVSAANEAFYQQLPLLILTADRNHYYMFQQEEQMIPQEGLYSQVAKKVVTLNHVRDEKDFWYTSRICNEALLELTQGEPGPVHINFIVENDYPIKQGIVKFEAKELPAIKKIERLTFEDSLAVWRQWGKKLKNARVLIVYGQHGVLTPEEQSAVDKFADRYNCVFSKDLISNLHQKYAVPTYSLCKMLSADDMKRLCPDIVITMNGNTISDIKSRLQPYKNSFEHWHVTAKGEVSDPFKCLPNVVACSPMKFFEVFAALEEEISDHSYFAEWQEAYDRIGIHGNLNEEEVSYSSLYITQQYLKRIPENSLLHLANSNTIRLANYFQVPDSVEVYDNRGTHGIDGSMSAFIGQAYQKNGNAYLLIGDLSFFYDMNALWNQYIRSNIRIVVSNNDGGAIFYSYPGTHNVPTLGDHIAAVHHNSVEMWAKDRGFMYLSCHNKDEAEAAFEVLFNADVNQPILLEAFTSKEEDVKCINSILDGYNKSIKHQIGKMMPKGMKETIKGFMK